MKSIDRTQSSLLQLFGQVLFIHRLTHFHKFQSSIHALLHQENELNPLSLLLHRLNLKSQCLLS
jgi:hypothetical protein